MKMPCSVLATAQKNKSREELIFTLQDLARYVETTANNDYTVLLSSGFEIHKDPTPGTLPGTPTNLVVKDGNHSGECMIHFDAPKNSLMFELRYTSTSRPEWIITEAFTKREYTILGQTRGEEIKIEVKAMNGHGSSDWSQPSTWFIR